MTAVTVTSWVTTGTQQNHVIGDVQITRTLDPAVQYVTPHVVRSGTTGLRYRGSI